MMTIQKRQFEAMGARLALRWEDSMVIHLQTFFPERALELGEPGLLGAIELGVKKASRYDINSERDVCKFLNFMFAYGFDFDTDPELPWAHAILTDEALVRSNVKMHLLEQAADGELAPPLEAVVLPTQAEMDAALRESAERDRAELARLSAETGDGDGTAG
jgi:hypothetical protein